MNPLTGKDYAIGALVGFFTGVFAIPVLVNINITSKPILIALPLAVAVVFAFGVWLGGFLSRWLGFFGQLGKFASVGFLNTAIDFGLLNFLSRATGITAGLFLGGINIPAAGIAMVNSYFWNKYWVFQSGSETNTSELSRFLIVTVLAIILNSSIVAFGTNYPAPFGLSAALWLNVAKILATVASFLCNFIGYKVFVFQKKAIVEF